MGLGKRRATRQRSARLAKPTDTTDRPPVPQRQPSCVQCTRNGCTGIWRPKPPAFGASHARHVAERYSFSSTRSTGARLYIPRIPSGTVGKSCISTVALKRGAMYSRDTVETTVELLAKTL